MEEVDYVAPTDAELAAMTDPELLGAMTDPDAPLAGPPVEHLAARYPICFGKCSREEAEAMGADFSPENDELLDECWIDMESRRLHHVPGCTCIMPADMAADCARDA